MVGIFLTALPMSIINKEISLFLVAFFSFYLAFAGRRFAQNRTGVASRIDWIAVGLMIVTGIGMWPHTDTSNNHQTYCYPIDS